MGEGFGQWILVDFSFEGTARKSLVSTPLGAKYL